MSDSHRQYYHAFFSWDDHWVVFKTAQDWNHGQILIAPVRSGMPAGATEWIAVTDGHHADDKAQFSPDGNQIYFTSDRDGYLCIWAQRLNQATKQPEGAPYVVQHLHSAGWYLKSYHPYDVIVSISRDKIVTNLFEIHSDIWMFR